MFLSSHLMSEMALTADHILVIGRGRIIADAPVADIVAGASGSSVRVRSPQAAQLADLLRGPDTTVTSVEAGLLEIAGATAPAVGELAAQHGLVLHELTPVSASLEAAYMSLTADDVEYHSATAAPAAGTTPEEARR